MGKTAARENTDARALLEELIRGCARHGTAVDGMTDDQVMAHMRRVRERLWNAKHAYRPRRK
jgi:hypothetical protein